MPASAWALDMVSWSLGDEALPVDLAGINVVLNRARLATFLSEFAEDKDVRDLLALDLIATAAGFRVSSTGIAEEEPSLSLRPFRLWEYAWLYKTLRLSGGGLRVLDLGGPSTPLTILAAAAGCRVTSLDINPEAVRNAEEFARRCRLDTFEARVGDMRDLAKLPAEGFDAIISCSVLEHLTAQDQETALCEMARVLSPGGLIGLTFDYGPPAPGANRYLPPPHDPPGNAQELMRRCGKSGLKVAGNAFSEDPLPDALFRDAEVHYTMASLFLAKSPDLAVSVPRCEREGSALGKLVIEQLPLRLYRAATHSKSTIQTVQDQLREESGRAKLLEGVAAERLAAMQEKEVALAQFAGEVEQQRARANVLEIAATERLAAMQEKDTALAWLHGEFERVVEELRGRADVLEAAAAARLAAMEERDAVIAQLHAELQRTVDERQHERAEPLNS
jgi:SAM-dependent methyltransferase